MTPRPTNTKTVQVYRYIWHQASEVIREADAVVFDQSSNASVCKPASLAAADEAFGGVLEVGSAVLLCFRRTATLGACVLVAAMTNVLVLDVAYGVTVVLFASVYFVMGVYVLFPELRRLGAVFLGDGAVPPRKMLPAVVPSSMRHVATGFGGLLGPTARPVPVIGRSAPH